ncbi:MAG: putative helicase, partial [Myxococcaceae bacterium]|nr:putative helicase [Myxococcaceae bacterium]
ARGARSRLLGFDTDPGALATVQELLAPEARRQGAGLELTCANTLELAAPFAEGSSVRVILGNPPWAARSLSRGGALSDAWLSDFRLDHEGRKLDERRAGVLSDDYVRFFRWALEQAREAQGGAVLCLATNGSFLDGPVHRGMRAALLKAFDRIELVDLGGNSLLSRSEVAGERDDNLFGVRVGAAVTWAVRLPRHLHADEASAQVGFGALRGSLDHKLSALRDAPVPLTEHVPDAPWFLFRPTVRAPQRAGFSIAQAFPFQREGVQTNRDAIAVAHTRAELEQRVWDLAQGRLHVPAQPHFDPARARSRLQAALERGEPCIAQLAYRPLDLRWFITLPPLCHRPRSELLRAVERSSLCLLAVRKDRGRAPFNLFAAATAPADACFLSTRSSCRTRVFPSHAPDGSPNLSPAIRQQLEERVGREVNAPEVVAYALSVLGSPAYRAEQRAALQLDYAHLPWPRDAAHFASAVDVGRQFADVLAHDGQPSTAALEVAVGVDRGERLRELVYQPAARQVTQSGRVILRQVDPSWWSARVGEQGLVQAVLRQRPPVSVEQLVTALARAAAWVEAERHADACMCTAYSEGPPLVRASGAAREAPSSLSGSLDRAD